MAEFPSEISPEITIIIRAQQLVDRWRGAKRRDRFETALARALEPPWDPLFTHAACRISFTRVADAIQHGEGHAFNNREPLLAITRQLLPRPVSLRAHE